MRAVTAQSDRLGRYFARQNGVSGNDFHALLHVMVAETAGTPLTMAQLRQRMDVSPAAITYLVDRMIEPVMSGANRIPQIDARRVSGTKSGMALAHGFFDRSASIFAPRSPATRRGPDCRPSGFRRDDLCDVDIRNEVANQQPKSATAAATHNNHLRWQPHGNTPKTRRASKRFTVSG